LIFDRCISLLTLKYEYVQESILNGPYIRRSGVGRHMTAAIHKLPAHAPPSERVALAQGRGDRAFLGPEDVNYEEWALGEKVSL